LHLIEIFFSLASTPTNNWGTKFFLGGSSSLHEDGNWGKGWREARERDIICTWTRSYLKTDVRCALHAKTPGVSKTWSAHPSQQVDEWDRTIGKRAGAGGEKKSFFFHILLARVLTLNWVLNFMSTKVKETKINPRWKTFWMICKKTFFNLDDSLCGPILAQLFYATRG
jgi:hypothetical protein